MSLISRLINLSQERVLRLAVAGDVMIDEYYDVEATRISPEFPIPVMRSAVAKPTSVRPGGAGNVVYQTKHWNTNTCLYSWMDKDAEIALRPFLPNAMAASCDVYWMDRPFVPRKRRIYDGKHPAFRWDIELPDFGVEPDVLGNLQSMLVRRFALDLSSVCVPDALILSDYNKGTFNTHTPQSINARQLWLQRGMTTIVDPKEGPLDAWRGCTIFKPNAKEAYELSGRKDWKDQCSFFLKQLMCDHVVITQGGEGVVGMSADQEFEYRPNFKVDPKSVIGAGDCFVAFLAMAYSHGFKIDEAAEIAFKAGACYVQHDRNEPITPYELLAFEDPTAAKYLTPPKDRDFKLGFTNGCFDLLHAGHLESLRFAKEHCDKLMVAINSNDSVRRLKGDRRPYIGLVDRMHLLAALDCVDYVVSFDEDTPLKTIDLHRPDVLVKGEDYRGKEVIGSDLVKEIIFAPLVSGVSTSQIEFNIQRQVKPA
jgi:D-beta-D-heptose 7-phosphate kinase/D-beta-D-heptose 1-phosphate adenosyltransferase